jgi:hypothetical protein
MLWIADEDSSRWRYKRRGTVLGFWHSLKLAMWFEAQRREDAEFMAQQSRGRRRAASR